MFGSEVFDINYQDLKRILSGDIYGKRFAKYILLKLDMILLDSSTIYSLPNTISIEHILPQNPAADSKWIADFTADEREEYTDKLGNLVLISRRKNTSQGNLDFDLKKKRYFQNNINVFPNSLRVLINTEWTPNELRNNQEYTLNTILKEYK